MLVQGIHALLMAEGVIEMHGTAAGYGEVLGDAVLHQCLRDIIRKLLFHMENSLSSFYALIVLS